MLRHRRALFKKIMNKVFLKMGNEVFPQAININSLPISTPKDLMASFRCSFNTLAKMGIPRKQLFPGSRKYVYLQEDILDYFRALPTKYSIDEEFLSS
jgi:hypothetical protein